MSINFLSDYLTRATQKQRRYHLRGEGGSRPYASSNRQLGLWVRGDWHWPRDDLSVSG